MDHRSTRERIMDAAERLVHQRGFAGTSLDAVIAESDTSKGAFFHNFASKADLGRALVERYARADEQALESVLRAAEDETDDPAEQLVACIRMFEEAADTIAADQPGCLFVSFLYAREQVDPATSATIEQSIELWRRRLSARIRMAARSRAPACDIDVEALADHVFTVFEGGFILARATNEPPRLRAQLAQLRQYLALVFGVPSTPAVRSNDSPKARA